MDLAKTIEPQMRPHMITSVRKLTTVVLDPGHGGYDKGATSKYGYEKDYALDVARKLRPLLQAKGLKVILTREGDYFVPLEVRARIANRAKDAIFVSIHFNATDRDPAASGFEIYCLTPRGAPSTSDDSLALSFMNVQPGTGVDTHSVGVAACIYHSILGHTDEPDRGNQTRALRRLAAHANTVGLDRRRFHDRTRREQNDREERMARRFRARHQHRHRKLPRPGGEKTKADDRGRLSKTNQNRARG